MVCVPYVRALHSMPVRSSFASASYWMSLRLGKGAGESPRCTHDYRSEAVRRAHWVDDYLLWDRRACSIAAVSACRSCRDLRAASATLQRASATYLTVLTLFKLGSPQSKRPSEEYSVGPVRRSGEGIEGVYASARACPASGVLIGLDTYRLQVREWMPLEKKVWRDSSFPRRGRRARLAV
jgi:hypothetical protein